MNAQAPSDRVREIVASFLQSNGLLSLVDVGYALSPHGGEVSLKPRAEGAADLVVRTAGDAGSYVVYVFVADEESPIEIAGPINENTDPPFRTADEELLEILRLVATGQVFDDVDEEGQILGSEVPEPRTTRASVEGTERRRWYKPWA